MGRYRSAPTLKGLRGTSQNTVVPRTAQRYALRLTPAILVAVSGRPVRAHTWSMTLNVNCPHCGEMHAVSVRETYIDDAIRNVSEIARRV